MPGNRSTRVQNVFRAVTLDIPAMFGTFVVPILVKPFHDSFNLRDRTFLKTFIFISSRKALTVLDVVLLTELLKAREVTASVTHTVDDLDLRTGNDSLETLCEVPPISWQDVIPTAVDEFCDQESPVPSF